MQRFSNSNAHETHQGVNFAVVIGLYQEMFRAYFWLYVQGHSCWCLGYNSPFQQSNHAHLQCKAVAFSIVLSLWPQEMKFSMDISIISTSKYPDSTSLEQSYNSKKKRKYKTNSQAPHFQFMLKSKEQNQYDSPKCNTSQRFETAYI